MSHATHATLGLLVDRWVSDPAFRAALARDPRAATREAGLELNEMELELLANVDWECSDAALEARLSASC